jgi:osmotically-inducible protein OsmY
MTKRHATSRLALLLALAVGVPAIAADPTPTQKFPEEASEQPADNTGRNLRDRDGSTLTPADQSGDAADRELVQKIRQEVVADDSLSTLAHNVKIVSQDGVVTLRGPVRSDAEREQIVATAERYAGSGKVHNQLEVAR